MTTRNVDVYRAGHQAFNSRDFGAMTMRFADRIAWTDHARGDTYRTSKQFTDDFLRGWVTASSDIRILRPTYLDAGPAVVSTFDVVGTHDGRLGPFSATGRPFAVPLCEMWRFGEDGDVVGGDLYYDQMSLLTQLGVLRLPPAA